MDKLDLGDICAEPKRAIEKCIRSIKCDDDVCKVLSFLWMAISNILYNLPDEMRADIIKDAPELLLAGQKHLEGLDEAEPDS